MLQSLQMYVANVWETGRFKMDQLRTRIPIHVFFCLGTTFMLLSQVQSQPLNFRQIWSTKAPVFILISPRHLPGGATTILLPPP